MTEGRPATGALLISGGYPIEASLAKSLQAVAEYLYEHALIRGLLGEVPFVLDER